MSQARSDAEEQAIRMALTTCQRFEEAMSDLYRTLADAHEAADEELSRIWRRMSREELQHANQFRFAMGSGLASVVAVRVDVAAVAAVTEQVRKLQAEYQRVAPKALDALTVTLRIEEEQGDVHAERSITFSDEKQRKLFSAMSSSDAEHVGRLRAALAQRAPARPVVAAPPAGPLTEPPIDLPLVTSSTVPSVAPESDSSDSLEIDVDLSEAVDALASRAGSPLAAAAPRPAVAPAPTRQTQNPPIPRPAPTPTLPSRQAVAAAAAPASDAVPPAAGPPAAAPPAAAPPAAAPRRPPPPQSLAARPAPPTPPRPPTKR